MSKQKTSFNYLFLVAVILLVGYFGLKFYQSTQLNNFKKNILPQAIKKVINNEQAKYTIGEVKEVNGVYEFELTVNNQKYISYISKDGKILFPSGVNLEKEQPATESQTKKLTCQDLKKTDSPNLTAFVVADCPYGLQMQRLFKTTISDLPELDKTLSIKYIGTVENGKITSMHGDNEAQENLRQICIREEQKQLYWPYVSCYMQEEGKSKQCLTSAGVDTNKLSSCISDKNRGLKYAQSDFDLAKKFNIGSSPTLLLNNKQLVSEFDFGGRTANVVKDILCCGSSTKANYCKNEISKNELAVSFSKSDQAVAGATNQNAGCSN